MGEDILGQISAETREEFEKNAEKFRTTVPRLTDIAFAALFTIVMEERVKRVERLIAENPIVRRMAMEDLVRAAQRRADGSN